MDDWRRYTGTPRSQLILTVLALVVIVVLTSVAGGPVGGLPGIAVVVTIWFVGLLVLGLRERRQWTQLREKSAFGTQAGAGEADLEAIVRGYSVTVTTDLDGILSQTYTEIATAMTDVDASFTVVIATEDADGPGAVSTGNDAIDERYTVRGSEQNVDLLLSADVQSALVDLETPGTLTVTADRVVYEVPFTSLSPAELETAASTVVTIAERVEELSG